MAHSECSVLLALLSSVSWNACSLLCLWCALVHLTFVEFLKFGHKMECETLLGQMCMKSPEYCLDATSSSCDSRKTPLTLDKRIPSNVCDSKAVPCTVRKGPSVGEQHQQELAQCLRHLATQFQQGHQQVSLWIRNQTPGTWNPACCEIAEVAKPTRAWWGRGLHIFVQADASRGAHFWTSSSHVTEYDDDKRAFILDNMFAIVTLGSFCPQENVALRGHMVREASSYRSKETAARTHPQMDIRNDIGCVTSIVFLDDPPHYSKLSSYFPTTRPWKPA